MFVDFNILNQLGSPSINSNTFANRPAAGQTGRLFVSTDTFELYRDNGTGWDLIGGPGSSTVTGSGAAGQVTYWTGASTIGGNNDLFWDTANSRLGIGTTTPGHKLQINGTGTLLSLNGGSDTYMLFAGNGSDQYQIGYTDNAADYRRFSIYDSTGAKEVLTIDKQSRYVGINYQYSSLADQPQYTLDVSGSARATDNVFLATSGTAQVGVNTTSPTQATALIEAAKTDGYGLFLNYATASGSGSTATALWALNTTAGSGFAAVIEEKTANTTGGQYPLLIKHSLSTGTAAAGMGTGLHFQLPDSTGTFKTTQLTVETTDAAAATYTTRYRFMSQVNATSTALAYLTSVGLGIGNVIPSYKLDVNGVARVFGAGNTGRFLAVDTNVSGASVELNPQYGTGLPILQSVGSFPLLFGTNSTEVGRFTTAGLFGIGTSTPAYLLDVNGQARFLGNASTNSAAIFNNTSGASGTRQYYTEFNVGATQIATMFRGNGASGVVANGLNIDCFAGFQVRANQLGGSGDTINLLGGNVLIGTTTDAGYKLDVNGVIHNNAAVFVSQGIQGNSSGFTFSGVGSNYGRIYESANDKWALGYSGSYGGASTAVLNWTSGGLVGIGTSTPATKLHVVQDSTYNALRLDSNATNVYTILDFANNGSVKSQIFNDLSGGDLYIRTIVNSNLLLGTNSTTKLTITNGGNVLIGTSTDNSYKFVSNGTTYGGQTLEVSDSYGATQGQLTFASTGWGNVSSYTFDLSTLLPRATITNRGIFVLLNIITQTGSTDTSVDTVQAIRNLAGTWTFNSLGASGSITMTFSGSGSSITINFSSGGQFGRVAIQFLNQG